MLRPDAVPQPAVSARAPDQQAAPPRIPEQHASPPRIVAQQATPPRVPDDYDIILLARAGDEPAVEFLLEKYKGLVKVKARPYFLIGADRDDLIQEGMIGLYKAIRDYRFDKHASFRGFAELCVTRQIITAIKTATRQKHIPLNSYVSLNRPLHVEDESERVLAEVLGGCSADPMDVVISGEEVQSIRADFGAILSDLEARVLRLYLEGKRYNEIADGLGRHVKSIDNALQRVKRKIEVHLARRAARV